MRKRLIQLSAALLAIVGVAGLVYLFGFLGQTESPMFVVYDDNHPSEALAVYPDSTVLRKHRVSVEKFEAAFRAQLGAVGEAMAHALVGAFFSEPSEPKRNERATTAKCDQSRFGFTLEAYQEILETTRVERWALHSDGTHTVIEELPWKKTMPRSHSSASPGGKSSDVSLGRQEGTWRVSTPPITLEKAKGTFTKNTGITWPVLARDVHFDESRVPLLGDGVFYVVFTVPPKVLETWLESAPPWDMRQWLQGPVPAEVGCHCGFGFQSPSGWSAKEGGPKEYSGGAAELLKILKSEAMRYVARDRGPVGNPWYNGDLLILDVRTGVVRYCSWDM